MDNLNYNDWKGKLLQAEKELKAIKVEKEELDNKIARALSQSDTERAKALQEELEEVEKELKVRKKQVEQLESLEEEVKEQTIKDRNRIELIKERLEEMKEEEFKPDLVIEKAKELVELVEEQKELYSKQKELKDELEYLCFKHDIDKPETPRFQNRRAGEFSTLIGGLVAKYGGTPNTDLKWREKKRKLKNNRKGEFYNG